MEKTQGSMEYGWMNVYLKYRDAFFEYVVGLSSRDVHQFYKLVNILMNILIYIPLISH